jgi:signal transduction histidine kinase
MSSRWYKSLYWRIAIGFVLSLAAILVVQAMLFVWTISRNGPVLSGQPPDRFARTLARDLGEALERDPQLDVVQFVLTQFGRSAHPYFVLMEDGRTVDHAGPYSEPLRRAARARLQRWGNEAERSPGQFPGGDRPGFDRPGPRRPDGAFGSRPEGAFGPPPWSLLMPVMTQGERRGVVAVWPQASFSYVLIQYAPTLAAVAVAALLIGGTLAAALIFGPARRRLRAVEDAARRLGSGGLTARAPARGGDEVAAVAAAFNSMATDLAARAEALAASDRTRRQLLADVSHELTTPMTALRGYLETLRMPELQLDEATRERYLDIMDDETARLDRIIGDLLDLARLEGGGGAFAIADVATAELFNRVLARHERNSQEAGVKLVAKVEPGAETLIGDRDRLEQALQNLAANALRFAPAGSAIELDARRDEGAVVVTITDAGPGIPPEHLPHVFDRFYKVEGSRAPHARAATAGSGLGLSIVRAIVERHGGDIAVTSEPGRTVFTLRFATPAAGDEDSASAPDVP